MSDKEFDYKDTLLMPKTAFEMRANLVAKESDFRQFWFDKQIYQKALRQNKGGPRFILHDGPPYANGNLHVGHAVNKILKDIVVRYRFFQGNYAPFVPGWDTHGLPIENKMLNELKKRRNELDKLELRQLAKEYALSQIAAQTEQFKAMNLFTDFSEIYVTMDPAYEAAQLKLFKKMYFDGLVYKGLKPIFWSPSSQSALAEAEVEYEEMTSPQVLVAFPSVNTSHLFFVIMTTTPWTIPANAGISVHPTAQYVDVQVGKNTYVVAANLVEETARAANWTSYKVTNSRTGAQLAGLTYTHPLTKKVYPVVLGEHVSLELGTGLVHTAPLFGIDDFFMGKKYQLEEIMHVNDDGTFSDAAPGFVGEFYLDANLSILAALKAHDLLVAENSTRHSYPHDWRTHKPVIYRATPQWFVSIDKIKPAIMTALESVVSVPSWGVARLRKMIETRSDWTISRQRTWGVPIIIFYDENGEEVRDPAVFDFVIDLVAKHGTDIWFSWSTDELLPPSYAGKNYTKEEAIVDVWFDSGASSIAVTPVGEKAPFEAYLEGSDQYRGWFNSSLINSVAYRKAAPFKTLISHGFVLDEKLQKMSKSKGNTVDPFGVIRKEGADILRLWVANAEFTSDITISPGIINQTVEIYRNIRTKLRFMLGNLNGWQESWRVQDLTGYDSVVAEKIANLQAEVLTLYSEYKFAHGVKTINNFITELSGFYLDYAKDELYADASNSLKRRSVLTNIFDAAHTVILLLAPVLVATAEEAYQELPVKAHRESVHLEHFDFKSAHSDKPAQVKYAALDLLRSQVNKLIDEARQSGAVRRAQEVHFNFPRAEFTRQAALNKVAIDPTLFDEALVSQWLMLGKLSFSDELPLGIVPWDSAKCARCWRHFDHGQVSSKQLCQRCEKVLS